MNSGLTICAAHQRNFHMKSRYKTYIEFLEQTKVVHRPGGGIKIFCEKNISMILESRFKPWNSPETKHSFLVKLYIREVLWKQELSKKIARIEGFEWLGKRVVYKKHLSVVCDTGEVVDPETGEILLGFRISNDARSHPYLVTQIETI